jgi:hypothetical protein
MECSPGLWALPATLGKGITNITTPLGLELFVPRVASQPWAKLRNTPLG